MTTTRSLTEDGVLECTTFFGGVERGRCFTFRDTRTGRETTLTEEELMSRLGFE